MIIGIIGSGGREHSICSSLYKSKKVKKIFCFPGNAGTENVATNIKINQIIEKMILENPKQWIWSHNRWK